MADRGQEAFWNRSARRAVRGQKKIRDNQSWVESAQRAAHSLPKTAFSASKLPSAIPIAFSFAKRQRSSRFIDVARRSSWIGPPILMRAFHDRFRDKSTRRRLGRKMKAERRMEIYQERSFAT